MKFDRIHVLLQYYRAIYQLIITRLSISEIPAMVRVTSDVMFKVRV